MKKMLTVIASLLVLSTVSVAQEVDAPAWQGIAFGSRWSNVGGFGGESAVIKSLLGDHLYTIVPVSFGDTGASVAVQPMWLFGDQADPVRLGLRGGIGENWEGLGPDGDMVSYFTGSVGGLLTADLRPLIYQWFGMKPDLRIYLGYEWRDDFNLDSNFKNRHSMHFGTVFGIGKPD